MKKRPLSGKYHHFYDEVYVAFHNLQSATPVMSCQILMAFCYLFNIFNNIAIICGLCDHKFMENRNPDYFSPEDPAYFSPGFRQYDPDFFDPNLVYPYTYDRSPRPLSPEEERIQIASRVAKEEKQCRVLGLTYEESRRRMDEFFAMEREEAEAVMDEMRRRFESRLSDEMRALIYPERTPKEQEAYDRQMSVISKLLKEGLDQ